MEVKMLDKKYHLNEGTGCRCRYVRSDTEYFRPHYHNYYEIFLMWRGEAMHLINGEEHKLSEGQLLFIRDFDIHDYKSVKGKYFEFINLAFSKETLNMLFEYLGEGFPAEDLLRSALPPAVMLSQKEKERLFFALTDTPQTADNNTVKLRTRMLISKIFTSYFLNFKEKTDDIPLWLEITVEKMKNPQNFIEGVTRMYELSGKTREHLSRCMKQYYHTTPTAFVNDLRLDYCANLLISSNLSVIEIGFECGFENISWFYKAFEEKYGTTPLKYRKKLII